MAETLVLIEANEKGIGLTGLIGKPGHSRPTRKEMIFFVNRRPVDCKAISYAVLEAYHTFAPKGRFPPAILFVSIDPSLVDVNVHPAKREIRFREEPRIRSFVVQSLLKRNRDLSGKENGMPPIEFEKDPSSERMVPSIDPRALEMYGFGSNGSKRVELKAPKIVRSMEQNEPIEIRHKDGCGQIWRLVKQSVEEETVKPNGDLLIVRMAIWPFFRRTQGMVGMQTLVLLTKGLGLSSLKMLWQRKILRIRNPCCYRNRWNWMGLTERTWRRDWMISEIWDSYWRNLVAIFSLRVAPSWMDKEHAGKFLKDFLKLPEKGGGIPYRSVCQGSF